MEGDIKFSGLDNWINIVLFINEHCEIICFFFFLWVV